MATLKKCGKCDDEYWAYTRTSRDNPHLIEAIESYPHIDNTIIEIPKYTAVLPKAKTQVGVRYYLTEWEICEYGGIEWVAEKHRVWRP